jgi:hypothetical protein
MADLVIPIPRIESPSPNPIDHHHSLTDAGNGLIEPEAAYPNSRVTPMTEPIPSMPGPVQSLDREAETTNLGSADPADPRTSIESDRTTPGAQFEFRVNEVFELRVPDNFFAERPRAGSQHHSRAEPPRLEETRTPIESAARPATTAPSSLVLPAQVNAAESTVLIETPAEMRRPSFGVTAAHTGSESAAPRQPLVQTTILQVEQKEPPPAMKMLTPVITELRSSESTSREPSAAATAGVSMDADRPGPKPEQPRLSLGSRPATEPAAAPQPKLRINRIDIQVINQPQAPQTSTPPAPDIAQQLERRYLGRTDMIL